MAEDPEDPGFPWCCLCGGAGVGCTDALVMCSSCKLNGFCSGCVAGLAGGAAAPSPPARPPLPLRVCMCVHIMHVIARCMCCQPACRCASSCAHWWHALLVILLARRCIWRFTGDDLAAALNEGAQWECPLCRPEPKLRLAYAEDEEGRGAGGSSRGRAGKARSQPPEQQAAAAGVRRSGRQRQVPGTPAEFQCVVDLSSGSSGDEFEPEPEPTARRQPARAGAAKAAAPKAPAGGRKPAAAAAAGAATAGGADRTGGGAVAQQQQAVRKRTRMLLPQGDIVSSPGADGELPAHVHQKQRMRPQLAGLVSQQRQGLQASQQQANAKLKAMFSQMNL